jgi:cell division septation protein DedD
MAGKESRHRFELSRLEIAGVLISTAAALLVVFLLGIYAGRGMAERRLAEEEQVVRLPVLPVPEDAGAGEESLTFDDALGSEGRHADASGARPAAADAPLPSANESRPAGATSGPAPPAAAPPADPATETAPVAAAPPRNDTRAAAAVAPAPARAAVGRGDDVRVTTILAASPLPTPQAKGEWSIQVSATRDPRTADAIVRRLRAKGYNAYVLKTRRDGATFYRVRVGHYPGASPASRRRSSPPIDP